MYPLLRYGDRLPSVVAAQILTNRKIRQGTYISVDGIYGPKTREAVRSFQKAIPGLKNDGIVGENTWRALTKGESLPVIDSVDVTDPKDIGYEDADIRRAGGTPIVNFGMCNGVKVVMQKIQAKARSGKVVLLRFHGHGAPGEMGLTVGTGAHFSSEFGVNSINSLAHAISSLSSIFSTFGSAELHGCKVGAGNDGKRLLRALANYWGIPVTAGLRTQYGGGSSTFRFEGPTVTAFPGGDNLKTWARSRTVAEVHGMCVVR